MAGRVQLVLKTNRPYAGSVDDSLSYYYTTAARRPTPMPIAKTRTTRTPASFTGAPGRWWLNVAVPALPVLACFLGGATQKWSEGIVAAFFGVMLLVHPPQLSLGRTINIILLALLACLATA